MNGIRKWEKERERLKIETFDSIVWSIVYG